MLIHLLIFFSTLLLHRCFPNSDTLFYLRNMLLIRGWAGGLLLIAEVVLGAFIIGKISQ